MIIKYKKNSVCSVTRVFFAKKYSAKRRNKVEYICCAEI